MIASNTAMMRTTLLLTAVLIIAAASPSAAQERSGRPVIRYGNTSSFWFFDGRDDQRDFRNNGVFPGNFAGDPPSASIGIEGVIAGNSQRSVLPYPSQVVMTPPKLHCTSRRRACK
jgi:hypothetical protein